MSNYLKEVVRELRLSTFPTQNTVVNFTIFVILFTAAVAAYLGALDVLFGKGTISGIEILKNSYGVEKIADVVEVATTTATSTN
jgi:preprotein translocase SecE subunit